MMLKLSGSLFFLLFALVPLRALTEQDLLGPTVQTTPNLIEYLQNDGEFKLLLSALKKADLIETLSGSEPFTLLAPTDDAFRRLPEAELDLLLVPSGKQKLAALLGLHLIPQKISSAELFQLKKVKTFQGQEIPLRIMAGNYLFDESKLLHADIRCANGLIQVIDRVIEPLP